VPLLRGVGAQGVMADTARRGVPATEHGSPGGVGVIAECDCCGRELQGAELVKRRRDALLCSGCAFARQAIRKVGKLKAERQEAS
jgi:hypothetical protein